MTSHPHYLHCSIKESACLGGKVNIFLKQCCRGDRIGAKDATQQKMELPSLATPSLLGAGLVLSPLRYALAKSWVSKISVR
jgi:hypothetical protein